MPLPLHPSLPLLLLLALPDRPDLFLHSVRAVTPTQGVVVRCDLLQALVLLCQPVKGGIQRGVTLLEPVIVASQPVKAVYNARFFQHFTEQPDRLCVWHC